jgi:hypothetical protein
MEMLAAQVAGETARAATLLQQIGESSTAHEMYGVCCALAETGKHFLGQIYGDQAPTPEHGMWVMQELTPGGLDSDPPSTWATRFLIARANGDEQQTLALFDASIEADGDRHVCDVAALLANVAGIAKLALSETSGGAA